MAPPGFYAVKRHARISSIGIKYFVKAHLRKNRGKEAILLPENILYLYWHGVRDYPRLGKVCGYSEFLELDSVIQFWLNYWKEVGLPFPKDLTPLHIKVLIAKESSFRIKADPRVKESTAYGLTQITNTTRQDLRGDIRNNRMSLSDHNVDLDRKDLEDPVISITAGIRWISYKYSSLPPKVQKNTFNTFRNYYRYKDGKNMLKKFLICIMILLKTVMASDDIDTRVQKVQRLHKMYLKLPDHREIIISYHDKHGEEGIYKIRVFLRQGTKILWDKTFSEDYGEFWTRASFMPVLPEKFFSDINDDNHPEIAISVSHGGMAVWDTPAMIFTIKENKLEFLRKQQTNEEFSEFVYSSEDDFKNPTYKCSVCKAKEYYYADGKKASLSDPRH